MNFFARGIVYGILVFVFLVQENKFNYKMTHLLEIQKDFKS